MLITAAAVRRLYSMKYMLVKLMRPMVTTFIWGLLITTIGQKNSFQVPTVIRIASVATGVPQACSPVAFPVSPAQLVCSTKDRNPQTYNGNQFEAKYLLKTHKGKLHGPMLYGNDTKDAQRGGQVLINTEIQAGIKSDQTLGVSGRDPQSAYTPIVNKMKQDGSNFGTTATDTSMILLRSEAQLQGLGKDVEFIVHPGVDHAFFNDTRPEVYDAEASALAWGGTLAFLRSHLS